MGKGKWFQKDKSKLKQSDRPALEEKALLDLAHERELFEQARTRERAIRQTKNRDSNSDHDVEDEDAEVSTTMERVADTIIWTISLVMLHFTLDVLVQHQYAMEISWSEIAQRAARACFVFALLFYQLHGHPSNPPVLPGLLPDRYQNTLRQFVFFVFSGAAGCYLIHITNTYSYYAVLKQAPPVGCLWVWCMIELALPQALLSLAVVLFYLWYRPYEFR